MQILKPVQKLVGHTSYVHKTELFILAWLGCKKTTFETSESVKPFIAF